MKVIFEIKLEVATMPTPYRQQEFTVELQNFNDALGYFGKVTKSTYRLPPAEGASR